MKANAPEKIYINPMPNPSDGYVGVAWSEPHIDMKEYTRTDAFIEKACSWLKGNAYFYVNDYTGSLNEDALIDEFRNYMKGE